ncbi:MAG: TSCPD domain-containing protein, partial [Anaerotignum sp.]|nr:TSCPD domain-containing protein [Anaerotignum sp.]
MHVKYDTKGICAVRVEFDVEDGVVKNISFLGGCDGNHKGLAALAEGMTP